MECKHTLNGIEHCLVVVAPEYVNVGRVLVQATIYRSRGHNCNSTGSSKHITHRTQNHHRSRLEPAGLLPANLLSSSFMGELNTKSWSQLAKQQTLEVKLEDS